MRLLNVLYYIVIFIQVKVNFNYRILYDFKNNSGLYRFQKDFFTKVWGDSFVEMIHVPNPSYLPNITKQHFESYLKKTSKVRIANFYINHTFYYK